MVTTAEIIFVGLCSFLNVKNSETTMPPPSVLVTNEAKHISFIAWDTNTVSVDGAVDAQPLGGSSYSYVLLGRGGVGDEVMFNDDRTNAPQVDATFDQVASFKDYSGIAPADLVWDTDYIPAAQQQPSEKHAAGYVLLGGGTLTGDRLTKVRYEFRSASAAEDTSKSHYYAREVHYRFKPTGANLLIDTRSLDGNKKRTMILKPKNGATNVEVWIGNSPDPISDILREEPTTCADGVHFAAFYRAEKKADDLGKIPLPRPVAVDCAGSAMILPTTARKPTAHTHAKRGTSSGGSATTGLASTIGRFRHKGHSHLLDEGDPELGYCGPDGKP